jgi:hypothetical protein
MGLPKQSNERMSMMKQARISFFMCIQDSQEFGSDDEYMVSRVFFNMEHSCNEIKPKLKK